MRVFGLMVAKDEAARYLKPVINWHMEFLDELFLFDDLSTDGTPELAEFLGAHVELRDEAAPSFIEHEGQFRQASWEAFEMRMRPKSNDWILSIDTDEFFVAQISNEHYALHELIEIADGVEANSVSLSIPEVFDTLVDGQPLVRLDGYWKEISGLRLFRYQQGGKFANRQMGCGSAPTYADSTMDATGLPMSILHYGYAKKDDREAKYQRYNNMASHGHNGNHIQSILQPPTLAPWQGSRWPA